MENELYKNSSRFKHHTNQIISKKYIIDTPIGKGAYSNVFKIHDIKKNIEYAAKIILNDSVYIKCSLKEIEIIKDFKHNNVVKYFDHFYHSGYLCIILKLYDINLYQYQLKQKYFNNFDTCNILIQVSNGLDYLKKNKIIHRDLKPENILVKNEHCLDKIYVIVDFGLSVNTNKLNLEDNITKYNVQTRWYRSPEIIFKSNYDESIDIWSLGCIAYELYWRKPLFKAADEEELFIKQNIILNPPPAKILIDNKFSKYYDDVNNPLLLMLDSKTYYSFKHKAFLENHRSNIKLIDFILKCCSWEPHKRPIPQEAINQLKILQKK